MSNKELETKEEAKQEEAVEDYAKETSDYFKKIEDEKEKIDKEELSRKKDNLSFDITAKEEEPEETEDHQDNIPLETKKTDAKQSWKELRDKADNADKVQKERDEYLALLLKIEEEVQKNQKSLTQQSHKEPQYQEEVEEEIDYNNIDDDEVLTGRDLKRSRKKDQERIEKIEQEFKRSQKESYEKRIERELSSQNPDFYNVLNKENISKLREMRPGLANSLFHNPDLKEQAMETYQAIKDLGIYQGDPYLETKLDDRQKGKPRSVNSVSPQIGDSPLSRANLFAGGLTPELKKIIYEDMKKKARG